jgi:hypothetical protein
METANPLLLSDIELRKHNSRQLEAISPEAIGQQASSIRPSAKFICGANGCQVQPYPGFAVLSMVSGCADNAPLAEVLRNLAGRISLLNAEKNTYYILPEHSWHQTMANTLSDAKYQEYIINKGLSNIFPNIAGDALSSIYLERNPGPLKMKMLGINIFGGCLAVLGIFNSDSDYRAVTDFRTQFYGSHGIREAGVRWTRPFVGHITLAYLGRAISHPEKEQLVAAVNKANAYMAGQEPVFHMASAELRAYADLAKFDAIEGIPELIF